MQWNKERLLDQLVFQPEPVFEAAGVMPHADPPKLEKLTSSDDFACEVCYESSVDLGPGEEMQTLRLPCDHQYCAGCYKHDMSLKVSDAEQPSRLKCMQGDCKVVLGDEVIKQLISPTT